jgi:general secretion pathway protein L
VSLGSTLYNNGQKLPMTTLIVTLAAQPPAAATLCDAVLTHDGSAAVRQVLVPLALLPVANGAEIVAIVPAGSLSWHQVELPRGTLDKGFFQESNAPRLRAVLDGLLEERLLDEPVQLHFAIEPQAKAQTKVWVAACDRTWLNAWLAALAQAGRPASRIVPELAPPDSSLGLAVMHVIGTGDDPKILLADASGVTLLPLCAATVALVAWPDVAGVLAEPGVALLAEQYFKGRVTLQTSAQRAMAAARSEWDLAQFDLLNTRQKRIEKRLSKGFLSLLHAPHWRAVRWATLLLVVVNVGGLQAWAWKEQSALSAKRVAIANTLTSTFPDVRVVVDAPLQMARAVTDLQRQSGLVTGADMEVMLARLQSAAPELQAPAAIEFIAGELRLKGLGVTANALSAIATKLQAQGYAVQLDGEDMIIKQAIGA